jgi:hypothetical protein
MIAQMALTDPELLAREEALHAEAKSFLDAHEVERRLAQAGRVLLVGSYVTGLMVWRDLDVCVDAKGLERDTAWELVLPFVVEADRVRYEHLDEPDDRRHYFVLRLAGWKLDLSLFTAGIPADVEEFQDELRSGLDHDTRLVILRLKELWHRRPEYPETVGGFEICQAVLDGARTVEQLEAHLRERGVI